LASFLGFAPEGQLKGFGKKDEVWVIYGRVI